MLLEIYVDLPKPPWFDEESDSVEIYKDMVMRWVIHAGKATPTSVWAGKLQTTKPPMDTDIYLNC